MVQTRRWVNNSAPTEGHGCALYLELLPEHSAPLRLIRMCRPLQELAVNAGGNEAYAKKMSKFFHHHRRKARAQYNKSLCQALFDSESPFCIAYNVLKACDEPPALSGAMGHFESIEALRECITSDEVYKDEKLFKLWVGLHASGRLYGASKRSINDSLVEYMSINYEAHCRLEASQRLSRQVTPPHHQHRGVEGPSCTVLNSRRTGELSSVELFSSSLKLFNTVQA